MTQDMDAAPPPVTPESWSWRRDAPAALGIALFCSLLFAVVTKQWLLPVNVPRAYTGDAVVYQTWVKTRIDEGTYQHNSRVGQPMGTDWRGFPASDGWLNWQVIRGLALFNPDPAWALNWFYWLSFPLAGGSAFAVGRLLRRSRGVAAAVAVLFDFLPYHLMRYHTPGNEHVFLAAYYLVPWSLLACLRWPGENRRGLAGFFALAALTGLGHAYYAFFAAVAMLAAGAYRARADRRWAPAALAVLWGGIVTATLLLTMLPEIRYAMTAAPNPDLPKRHPAEAETFGLKFAQLLLPVPDHQVPALAYYRAVYQAYSPMVNENETAALGAVGSAGLLYLLARVLFRRPEAAESPVDLPGVVAVVLLLLALVGGFASVINWTQHFAGMNPWIRGYNRVSVFLGFLALLGLGTAADRWRNRLISTRGRRAFAAGLVVVTAAGLVDQTPQGLTRHYTDNAAHYSSDREFFARVEVGGAPGDFVFILGYRFYPECPIEPLTRYDHFRPYLHTKALTFNYGALRGEPNDVWDRGLSARPPTEIVEHLCRMDAFGLLIYLPAFSDNGSSVEAAVTAAAGVPPAVSPDGQFSFFDLRSPTATLKAGTPAAAWEHTKARFRNPLVPVWRAGFRYDNSLERLADVRRDFGRPAEIRVTNRLTETRQLDVRFTVKVTHADAAAETRWLRIADDILPVPPAGATIVSRIEVLPGETVIRILPAMTREEATAGRQGESCWMHMTAISWAER